MGGFYTSGIQCIFCSCSSNICQNCSSIGKTALEYGRCTVWGKTVKNSFIGHVQPVCCMWTKNGISPLLQNLAPCWSTNIFTYYRPIYKYCLNPNFPEIWLVLDEELRERYVVPMTTPEGWRTDVNTELPRLIVSFCLRESWGYIHVWSNSIFKFVSL